MSEARPEVSLRAFIAYAPTLRGDESEDAQVFCDRLFRAFGHEGYKEAGAVFEERVKLPDGRARFAGLRWGHTMLLEMKRRGENLQSPRVYNQVYEYWQHLAPDRPRYVALCNFDELWVYEFDEQPDEPMERLKLADLVRRWKALGFLLPDPKKPEFNNNRVEASDRAARTLGEVFRTMIARRETHARAQRFLLQCVVAMFAEDTGLLPRDLFSELVEECRRGQSSYDLLGGLFRQMNTARFARAGRYQNVCYVNSGLFATVDAVKLTPYEAQLLGLAANENWAHIHPAIFGTLFQATMNAKKRHEQGTHYTPEAAIFEHVVRPTLLQPWRTRIREASSLKDLLLLRDGLTKLRVLDPACGSGDFLYVAYRELKRLELELLEEVHERFSASTRLRVGSKTSIQSRQFFGIDKNPFAVELAKVTLMLGEKLAQAEPGLAVDHPLPLANLDGNIRCADALLCDWPAADVIVGNPPFQSKNKMLREFGPEYVAQVRARYPQVPGRADYCVYWFRRTHDALQSGARAGLVGTNTVRENYSREGALDYIVANGGTIAEAVSTMVWPGEAVVHVSIVNWVKGPRDGPKKLSWQAGDARNSPWKTVTLPRIPASLSASRDVTGARTLLANAASGACYQGQTHGHEKFLLTADEARALRADGRAREVVHPYLVGEDLVGNLGSAPSRWVIDLNHCADLAAARSHGAAFDRLRALVQPDIRAAAERERAATGSASGPRQSHAERWWRHWRGRGELFERLVGLGRYIACSRVTRRPIFEFVSVAIHPNDALSVFPLEDDYSFGVLQSGLHWAWFRARCSTMKGDWRYTSNTVFDSFPWPQSADAGQVATVAREASALRALRRDLAARRELTLRAMYAALDAADMRPLREAHTALDAAVRSAYGMGPREDPLTFLLDLNAACAGREASGQPVLGPGPPPGVPTKGLISKDSVRPSTP